MAVQANLLHEFSETEIFVIHPLFDKPEQKCDPSRLGKIKMRRSVRYSLLLLRGYLILITMMFAFHMLDLMGAFGHHGVK